MIFILLAAVVNGALGGFWYSFFGKSWMAELKLDPSKIDPKNPVPYIIAISGGIINAIGLSLVFHFYFQGAVVKTLPCALTVGAVVSVVFTGATMAKHYAFSGWSKKHFLIDYGIDLIGFLAMSAVLYFKD